MMPYKSPEQAKAFDRAWRAKNKERLDAKAKKWLEANKERVLKYRKEWHAANRDKTRASGKRWRAKHPNQAKSIALKAAHGITLEQFNELKIAQNNCCAICKRSFAGLPTKHIHVDHDHTTQKIRGVLCHYCNVGLAQSLENIETLQKMVSYLHLHNPVPMP